MYNNAGSKQQYSLTISDFPHFDVTVQNLEQNIQISVWKEKVYWYLPHETCDLIGSSW